MTSLDLYTLALVDGLPVRRGEAEIRYRTARLRETTVADERRARRLAERAVLVNGKYQLLASDADFQFALTALHIEAFDCDGQALAQVTLGDAWLDTVGKLSSHDMGLIEQRVFLLEMAAELRYGHITQADFDALVNGGRAEEAPGAPQRGGEGAGLRAVDPQPGHGPALLADFTGDAADGAAALDGR